MSLRINNNYGVITIDNEVVARVVGLAAMDCYGIVGMTVQNVKDGFAQLLKKENITKGINIFAENETIVIDLHIVVEYGTNISAIGENLVSTIKYKVKEFIGLEVGEVNIFIEGVRVDR